MTWALHGVARGAEDRVEVSAGARRNHRAATRFYFGRLDMKVDVDLVLARTEITKHQ